MNAADNKGAALDHVRPMGRLHDIDSVVEQTSLHRSTIYRMRERGEFPAGFVIGRRRRVWPDSELEDWKRSAQSRSVT